MDKSFDESGKRKLGLIVNPIAGIGGRIGLKGSDPRARWTAGGWQDQSEVIGYAWLER